MFFILGTFLPFYPPKSPKNKNFKKKEKKKTSGDIIILHKCTKNLDYMLYCSWDMVCDRCNCCFSFWATFFPFTPLAARKMKISIKWSKNLEISSFYTSGPKIMIICYTVPEIWHLTLFFILGIFISLKNEWNENWMKLTAGISLVHTQDEIFLVEYTVQKESTLLEASFTYFPFLLGRDRVDGCTEMLG